MIRRIDHIGIAVTSLEAGLPFWADVLGMEVSGMETVGTEKVKVAFLDAGPSRIELLEATDSASPIAKSIEKRGQGVHHVTLEVDDFDAAWRRLVQRGVRVIGEPRVGAGSRRVLFVHPASTGGVLVELVESAPRAEEPATIEAGRAVLVYLRDPQEKMWGVLRRLDSAGAVIEGVNLESFDDWIAEMAGGEASILGPSVLFVPMTRVDKLLLDRTVGELPSYSDRFERRVGHSIRQALG